MVLSVLTDAARIITTIPNKQRRALLVDLARYNDFTEEPTLMEQAFVEVGIRLSDYCHLLRLESIESRCEHEQRTESGPHCARLPVRRRLPLQLRHPSQC